jgi:hypothetical protein
MCLETLTARSLLQNKLAWYIACLSLKCDREVLFYMLSLHAAQLLSRWVACYPRHQRTNVSPTKDTALSMEKTIFNLALCFSAWFLSYRLLLPALALVEPAMLRPSAGTGRS